jgi:hypothetical protein
MTEIHIEKKPKPVWPWIIGALLFILAIILVFGNGWQDNLKSEVAGEQEVPREVTEYISYVRETEPAEEMDLHHDYTSEGIQRLALALEALVDETDTEGTDMDDKKDRLKQTADFIQQDPYSSTHADSIRAAFNIASELIASIQQQNFPELTSETERVRSAARDVDPQTLTLEQKTHVQHFFEESASALDAMAGRMNGNGRQNQERSYNH